MVVSTFDPSLCTMLVVITSWSSTYCIGRLHLKQPHIPVFFLTEANSPYYPAAVDVRGRSVFDAIAFAKSQHFAVSVLVNYSQ